MKKILVLLSLAFVSCEKKKCYVCEDGVKPTSFSSKEPIVWGVPYERCGMTESDMEEYVRSQFMIITATSGYAGSRQTRCSEK